MRETENGWYIVNPSNFFEAMRLGWLMWRNPEKIGALVVVAQEFELKLTPVGEEKEVE